VLRTATTINWFVELLPDVLADSRIQLTFTVDPGSEFQSGVSEYLESLGGRTIDWQTATEIRFDLAVAAHRSTNLSGLSTPLLILPHGPGYSRMLTQRADPQIPIPKARDRQGFSTVMALASDHDRSYFDSNVPSTVRFVVTGDPCLDELRVSRAARQRYRHTLGLGNNQTLVVISSTWGPYGALGQNRHIINQILGTLPADEYVVAAILHANIWNLHGDWQLRLWLRDALASGLRLIPHPKGWRQTITAADIVIGDHGSVTYYAATLGVPALLASTAGTIEIKYDTAIERSHRATQAFDATTPTDIQIRDAIANRRQRHDPTPDSTDDANVATQIGSAARIRALIAELLELQHESPHIDSPRIGETPSITFEPATAHWVRTSINDMDTDHPIVEVVRTPAHGLVGDYAPLGASHLSVSTDCSSTRLLNLADVLYDNTQTHTGTANLVLSQRPATIAAAATATGSTFYLRGQTPLTITHRDADRDIITSAIFALTNRPSTWQKITAKAGGREATAARN